MRRITKLARIVDIVASLGETVAELVSGILDRESHHLAMTESLNDRDEVFAKLIALNARINFEFAVLMERPDLADEIRRTIDMAGVVIEQISNEFKEKT